MKMSLKEFNEWPNKAITLLGMSGIGKTTLANRLPKSDWFHYSGDYRIGTQYLNEPILDNIKERAMEIDFLSELLRTDSIYISTNITVDNLYPISTYLGIVNKMIVIIDSICFFNKFRNIFHSSNFSFFMEFLPF